MTGSRTVTYRDNELIIEDLGEANRCVRDLVALSALPAMWVGRDVHRIAYGICDALFGMLRPILVYAEIKTESAVVPYQAARSAEGYLGEESVREVGRRFSPWLTAKETGTAFSIPNPLATGMTRMTFVPMGHSGVTGFIVAVSHLVHFPNELERLLLTVGANQAAIAIENAQLLSARRTTAHYEGAVVRLRSCLRDICYDPDEPKIPTLTVNRLTQLLTRQPHGERLANLLGELHDFSNDRGSAEEAHCDDTERGSWRDPSDAI